MGIVEEKGLGYGSGLVASSIYVFGSLMVFISMVWNQTYTLDLFIPAFSGASIGAIFIGMNVKKVKGIKTGN